MDLSSLAKSKTAVNQAVKSLSAAEVEKLIGNLQSAFETKKKREAAKEQKKKAVALKKLQAMMAEAGLSQADLAEVAGHPPSKRGRKPDSKAKAKAKAGRKVAPKYAITVDGEQHKWTGRGRMPIVFREFINNGGSLEDCLI